MEISSFLARRIYSIMKEEKQQLDIKDEINDEEINKKIGVREYGFIKVMNHIYFGDEIK
jgi:hypothetical protein